MRDGLGAEVKRTLLPAQNLKDGVLCEETANLFEVFRTNGSTLDQQGRQLSCRGVAIPHERIETLTHVIYRTAWVVAIFAGLITILPEFGINASALLAGVGLVGLAVGFGAQSLVKDIIAGLFILIENQFGRGDVVSIAGVSGTVEDVNLRRTLVRDLDGTQHSVPNGEIVVASNKSQIFSRMNEVVGVSYGDNLEQVFALINRIGEEMAGDAAWSEDIISAPKVLGIDGFGDSSVDIRVLADTQPGRQWGVTREFRLRIKLAFDEQGIEIPFPHRTLVTAGQKAADGVVVRQAEEKQ